MSEAVRTLAFSPNGQELAAGLKNGDLVLMEFPAMKKIAELIGTGEAIHELKFSPKGWTFNFSLQVVFCPGQPVQPFSLSKLEFGDRSVIITANK